MKNLLVRIGGGLAAVGLAGVAAASGPSYDVTTATGAITAGEAAIAGLGAAALVLIVGLKVWKRLRGAA